VFNLGVHRSPFTGGILPFAGSIFDGGVAGIAYVLEFILIAIFMNFTVDHDER
jgi:hypothetical protein